MTNRMATQRNVSRRKSAECTGLRIATTRIDAATAIVPTTKKTRKGMLAVSASMYFPCHRPHPRFQRPLPRQRERAAEGRVRAVRHDTSLHAPADLLLSFDLARLAFIRRKARVFRPVVPVLELLHVEVEVVAIV